MIKVSESVNGKFDIVLSDGYRSHLHNRGKVTAANSGIQTRNRTAKATNKHKAEKVNQHRPKSYTDKAPSVSKTIKSSKISAHFDKRLFGNKTLIKNKYGSALETSDKIGKSSLASNENAAFVTKNDLDLLEALTNGRDVPKELVTKARTISSDVQDKEINSSYQEENVNQNVEQTEKQPQSIIEPVSHVYSNPCQSDTTSYVIPMETTKPTAMRSSFAIGAPGLVINDLREDKAARHKHWIKQLELQIQEKKEKEQLLKKIQSSDVVSQIETEARNVSIANKTKTDYCSVKTVGNTSQQQEKTESLTGHVRGRGLISIMVSTDETQRQRQKIFEHQKAIELQVEDRKRQKREERERRLREEAMEDDRLAKERAELQKQFEEDSKKNKEKEEQARRRAHVLEEGISKAYQSAQQLKREKMKNRSQTLPTEEMNNKSSRNHHNHAREQENNQQFSPSDKLHIHSSTLTQGGSNKLGKMVPPLALSRSYSPLDTNAKSNHKTTSKLSYSMSKIKPNSLSVRDVKTSYSDPGSLGQSDDLIHKWVEEDVGASSLIDNNHVYNSSELSSMNAELMIPFHRTSSTTLFSETVSSQENNENVSENADQRYEHGENRKHHKKDRSIPEIHPTKTSLLREKATVNEIKNSSLMSRRYKETAVASQQTIQGQTSKRNTIKGKKSSCEEKETKNNPTHLLSQYTPTAHQEKILKQLSALRKAMYFVLNCLHALRIRQKRYQLGLLLKDQELKTRIFQVNEYEIST